MVGDAKTLFASPPPFYVAGVIDRYSRPEMTNIWSDQRKFEVWLEIEVLACEVMAEFCQIPKQDAAEIRKRARFSIPRILEIEQTNQSRRHRFSRKCGRISRACVALDSPGTDFFGHSGHDAGGAT